MSNTRTLEAEYSEVPWWLVLIQGIVAIILGILLFVRPTTTMIILIQFLGIYWLITGIFSIASLIWDRSQLVWKVVSGILGILAGILIIKNPLWSTLLVPATLAILLGMIGIVIGILQLIDAFRGSGLGTGILGVFSILLGFLLVTRPVIAGWSVSWVLGSVLIVGGILAIIAAFGTLYLANQLEETRVKADSWAAAAPTRQVEPVGSDVYYEAIDTIPDTEFEFEGASAAAAIGFTGMAVAGMDAEEEEGETISEEVGEVVAYTADEVETAAKSIEDSAEEILIAEVPEAILTGNVDPADPEEMAKFKHSLEYVEGIGSVYGAQLKEIGLVTCLDLLKSGASRKGREDIVEKSDISGKLVLKWVNHVDLYRIKGVGSEYADLLEQAGVDTVVELAQRNPINLFEKLGEVNVEKELVRKMPVLSQVEDWVAQAKGLPRVVSY